MKEQLINAVACPLCRNKAEAKLWHVPNANFSSRIKAFDIVRCSGCGLYTMSPFPTIEDCKEIYVKENTFSKPRPWSYDRKAFYKILEPLHAKFGRHYIFAAKRCYQLAAEKKNPRVLDIGCSLGDLLKEFIAFNPNATVIGTDIDPNAKLRAYPGCAEHMIIDDFMTMTFDEKFDIIAMGFVIEHLLNLREMVEKAVSLLKPGGILFLGTPDIGSPKAQQLRDRWVLVHSPFEKIGHVCWFDTNSMQALAKMFGLEMADYRHVGELRFHLPLWLQKGLLKLFGTDPASGRFIKYYCLRLPWHIVFDSLLARRLGYGECMLAFLRKT